jgi:hypothetical protein
MKEPDYRKRRNPMAHVATGLVGGVALFQLVVISGVIEVRGESIRRMAPRLYEPFLKLMGEHPDYRPAWSAMRQDRTEKVQSISFSGLIPTAMPTFLPESSNDVAEAESSVEEAVEMESIAPPAEEPAPMVPVKAPAELIRVEEPSPALEADEDIDGDKPVG